MTFFLVMKTDVNFKISSEVNIYQVVFFYFRGRTAF